MIAQETVREAVNRDFERAQAMFKEQLLIRMAQFIALLHISGAPEAQLCRALVETHVRWEQWAQETALPGLRAEIELLHTPPRDTVH